MGGKPRAVQSGPADACHNLYGFVRICLGEDVSDREIARRWGMEWKSFVSLKQGRRRLPRLDELERLATEVLGIDPAFVFQVGSGVPAAEVARFLSREHELRVLLERVTDAIFTVDPDGKLRDVNQRMCELLGVDRGGLVGRPLREFAMPGSAHALDAAITAILCDGKIDSTEVGLLDHRGHERIIDLRGVRVARPDGSVLGAQAIAHDVTAERRLQRELDDQRQLLQTIYDCVPGACILFERDGTIAAANAVVEQVCPARADEMIGQNAVDVFGDPGPAGCPVTRAFLTGRLEQQVSRMVNRSRQLVYVHRIAGPVLSGGRVDKVIEMLVDVTEQARRGDLRVLSLWNEQSTLPPGTPVRTDRRTSPRASTDFSARYARGDERDAARVTNLSSGGLFLETLRPARTGDEIDVEWILPGDESPVRTRGIVTWTRRDPTHDRPAGVGVRFVAVHPEFAAVTKTDRDGS